VLPGVGHLELVHAIVAEAVPEADGRRPVAAPASSVAAPASCAAGRLVRVVWLRPVAGPEGGRGVLVHLRPAGTTVEYEVQALDGARTVTYSQGGWEAPAGGAGPAPRRSPQELRDRCPRALDTDDLYARFRARGIDYGPFFRGLREVRVGDGEVF